MSKPFNDTGTKLGLIQDCEIKVFGDQGYGRISDNSNLLFQFTARINEAQDRFAFLAMSADGKWQWDDSNNTDYPIATRNIVSGQRDYDFALEHLEIEKVLIKDASGTWRTLDRILDAGDELDTETDSYLENNTGNTGTPQAYDKMSNAIFFDRTPDYNSTGGIRIYFKRGPNYFIYSDTTKKPGFASIFHDYLSIRASAMYMLERKIDGAKDMFVLMQAKETDIKEFYSRRNKDERGRLSPRIESNR